MKALLAVAVVLMLGGAFMLLAEVGAPAVWIAVIAVGIALVVIGSRAGGRLSHRYGR